MLTPTILTSKICPGINKVHESLNSCLNIRFFLPKTNWSLFAAKRLNKKLSRKEETFYFYVEEQYDSSPHVHTKRPTIETNHALCTFKNARPLVIDICGHINKREKLTRMQTVHPSTSHLSASLRYNSSGL